MLYADHPFNGFIVQDSWPSLYCHLSGPYSARSIIAILILLLKLLVLCFSRRESLGVFILYAMESLCLYAMEILQTHYGFLKVTPFPPKAPSAQPIV
jgi:hypothetical protein